MDEDARAWTDRAEALAFLGNSLLAPMSQTPAIGLDPGFWDLFPDFGSQRVRSALTQCFEYACHAKVGKVAKANVVQDVSVEYTHLFVGPPKPAAPPWETFYRSDGVFSGFGGATFEMRELLREAGLEVSNDNNQYADHVGIELLYLSALCERAQGGDNDAERALHQFAQERLLPWFGQLQKRVCAAAPDGYYTRLLALVEAVLTDVL